MFNQWIGIGRLTRDVEVRYTPQGTPIANFDLATNYKYKENEEKLFTPCIVIGKQAESCGQYIGKGSLVMVVGRLKEEKWEKDGEKKSKIKVIVSNVKFLGSKGDRQQAEAIPEETSELEPF